MRLTASKRLRYLGVSYDPGEELEADGKWADLLQRAKLARIVVETEHAPRRGRPKGSTNKPKAPAPEQPTPTVTNTDTE
jgi:hypothetical protein